MTAGSMDCISLAASGAGAIEGLTRGLAVELASIRVNAVQPGVIRTPMWNTIPGAAASQHPANSATAQAGGRPGRICGPIP
jgi:NAD(P)-dependent dehydrogenase (short-subunit alcohol dehydrogenase family)